MWQQPDSAIARLLQFAASPRADSLDSCNGHYCQLLISELLYKKDYAQSNRPALRRAVAYFDSLTFTLNDTPSQKGRIAGADPLSLTRNDCITFLAARAHYINGVGYYENDSLVEACAEYLKALEVMEGRFEEKDLVGTKAKFMAYTYNRLGYMFEERFMLEPAIDCYKCSYDFSIISPISLYSTSIALYRIGKQYNMKGNKDSANYYYSQALDNMPDSTNPFFRDIVSTKALLSYQLTHQAEVSLYRLKQMTALAEDEDERLTRNVVIGDIFFEEKNYDSALVYLEPVLENKENQFLQIKVANYLRIIYDSLGNKEKHDVCMRYLAIHNETGAENSALVSQLSNLYKMYMSQKQEKEAKEQREAAIKKTMRFVIPLAVALALVIIVMAKLRSKQLLKDHRKEANKELGEKEQQHQLELEVRDKQHAETIEAERQAHRMEQAAISGRLKRKNEELRDLKEQIKRQDELDAIPKQAESFTDEPICRLILERVHDGQFKSKIDCGLYKSYALNKQQMLDLRMAVDRHYNQFTLRLRKAYPKLTSIDIDYCCLYLLNLTYADVSALMQRAYNTVVERDSKIQKVFGGEKPLPVILMDIAQNPSSI
jgi:tetratricopeptide (TPR) repeat protein